MLRKREGERKSMSSIVDERPDLSTRLLEKIDDTLDFEGENSAREEQLPAGRGIVDRINRIL